MFFSVFIAFLDSEVFDVHHAVILEINRYIMQVKLFFPIHPIRRYMIPNHLNIYNNSDYLVKEVSARFLPDTFYESFVMLTQGTSNNVIEDDF